MQPEFGKEEQENISLDEEDFEEEYEDEEDEDDLNDDIDDESPDLKGSHKSTASSHKGKKSKTVCSEDIKNEILDKSLLPK